MSKKKKQFRVEFRKNRSPRARDGDLTRRFEADSESQNDLPQDERISGKGDLTRKRTVEGVENAEHDGIQLDVDESQCLRGRVIAVHGLLSHVHTDDGRQFACATRRILKTLTTEMRHVVVAGDIVWFRPSSANEGIIERVEPRYGVLSRMSRGRQHIIAANVDQWLVVASAGEPHLKPHLIDRYLVCAEQAGIDALVCINKIDLIDPIDLQPLVGVYSQMGYEVLLVSVRTGCNIDRLRRRLIGRQTVLSGQSGVGKSSLLNAIEPGLDLRVGAVSEENEKGKHTTTTARVIPLSQGGYVVDTPGLRQFQLWDLIAAEVPGYFRDVRPFAGRCKFPDCTHTHERNCAVKDAVADGWLDARRYESMQQMQVNED